jgi:spore coat protein A, manganese oxidase
VCETAASSADDQQGVIMTFARVSSLGSTGLLLLPLLACSARSANDSAPTEDAFAQKERADSNAVRSNATDDASPCAEPLDREKLKWKSHLAKPAVFVPTEQKNEQGLVTRHDYKITVKETKVQMLPEGCKPTQVLAYGGLMLKEGETQAKLDWSSPGPTFEMTRDLPARVQWVNEIGIPHMLPVDPTLHWANPKGLPTPNGPFDEFPPVMTEMQSPVPIVTHVHGLEVNSDSDGSPEAWFTATGVRGPKYNLAHPFSDYPNSQPGTTLWYHDHALGITRLNVYAGLAGMYIIRDPKNELENPASGASALPDRAHEMPLVIQDKSFKSDGSLAYTSYPSEKHPYWASFHSGDFYVVNGKVWPEMTVDRTRYRFRMLNAANSRTYNFSLPEKRKFTVIGSDGGFLAKASEVELLKLAPGERADVLIDFSDVGPGNAIILSSDGEDVVRFKVPEGAKESEGLPKLPETLNTIAELTSASTRTVTMLPAPDDGFLLDGRSFHDPVSEQPRVGTTEDWDIVNISGMGHPIHLHLVQFRVISRKTINSDYRAAWLEKNGSTLPLSKPAVNPAADAYLTGESTPIEAADTGWKDTVIAPADQVTRIRVRWAPQDATNVVPGKNSFTFDPTAGPGYVWHCHMLEHEDNDMMRPLKLVK